MLVMKCVRMLAALLAAVLLWGAVSSARAEGLYVVASTFPMYQLLQQVTQGREGMRTALLIPAQTGCPHDYMMSPADMRKLESADVLVLNGLGMEDFLNGAVASGRVPAVIDTSAAVPDVLPLAGEEEHGSGRNPHLFTSPRNLARMARYLGAELGRLDAGGAALFAANADRYAQALEAVAAEAEALGGRLACRNIVTQHGVFDYLARDMGLHIVAVVQAHAGHEPSAAELIRLSRRLKEARAGAIFIEPQYPRKAGETLSRESGVPLAALDPAASGPEDAPLDYTLSRMRENLHILEETLGTH